MKPGVDIVQVYGILRNAIYEIRYPFRSISAEAIDTEKEWFDFWAPAKHMRAIFVVSTEGAVLVQSSEVAEPIS